MWSKNNRKLNILLFVGYLIMMIPMFYSMYYSVPAIDDFAFGANTVSDNLLINALGYVAWNWKNWSGRWLTFFIQKLTCPLNLHIHLGHIYGLIMIVLFVVFSCVLVYSLNMILKFVLNKDEGISKIATFVTVAILFTTNYYSEVYNWYIGATAYALPMVLLLMNFGFTLSYFESGDRRLFIGMLLSGIYPAVNEMYDVPIRLHAFYYMQEEN